MEKDKQRRCTDDSLDAQDTVNSEVYVKTPIGHSAVNMDPWTSSTGRKPWNKLHTPKKVTKDKLSRFTQQKTHRGISLNKTAGRQGWSRRNNWSLRPNKDYNPRALGLISGPCTSPSSRQQKLNKVRKEEASPNPRKRVREATPFNPYDAPVVISSDEEEEEDKTSPTSLPDHEKGHPEVYEYQLKSPVYPPPSDSSEEEDFTSIPDLVTPAEEMFPVPDHLNDSGYETQGTVPADVNANQDSFQDKDKQETLAQVLEDDLSKAPWQKESAKEPLEDLEKITKVVKPIYDGFWQDRDQDIIDRLDQAAKRLKERRVAQLQDNKEDDTAIPATSNLERSCSICNEPIGHHVLQCTKETLQDTLKEVTHSTPVEPLTGPPKIVHPFPEISPQTLLPPPPGILANFSVKLNSVGKIHTGPPSKEAQMMTTMATQPRVVLKKLSPEEIQNHSSSA